MVVLALLGSLVWGASDFVAGTASRRLNPLAVTGAAHAVGLGGLLVWAGSAGGLDGASRWGLPALASGALGYLGLAALYAALARGRMGVVAPIAASGAVVPVLWDLVRGDLPGPVRLLGLAAAIAGCILASGPELRRSRRADGTDDGTDDAPDDGAVVLALAVFSALFLGILLLVLSGVGDEYPAQTLVGMRTTSVVLAAGIALSARSLGGLTRRDVPTVVAVGVGDTLANVFVVLAAASGGSVAVTSVLGSLFPVTTVVLARVVHDERLSRVQLGGVGTALAGVALIAAG